MLLHTSTPARASRKPSIMPAGPPPAMQHGADDFGGGGTVGHDPACSLRPPPRQVPLGILAITPDWLIDRRGLSATSASENALQYLR